VAQSIIIRVDSLKLRFAVYYRNLEELEKVKKDRQRLEAEYKELKALEKDLEMKNEKMRKELEILEKSASEFSYRVPPQDRLTCDCHSRMGQFFRTLGPR
ncbi:hypothetical protein PENTCL1PPCAC_19235, partial [Pristionchus entomophagus]